MNGPVTSPGSDAGDDPARSTGRRVRRRVALALALLVLVVLAGAAVIAVLASRELRPPEGAAAGTVDVAIPSGASLPAVARLLEDRGVVRNAEAFRWLARLRGDAGRIRAGYYRLPTDAGASDVLDQLVEGRTRLERIVIPEGLTVDEAAQAAAEQAGFPAEEYLALARDSSFADSLGVPGPTLEGYLFPETYLVDPDVDARELIELQVRTFRRTFEPELARRAAEQGFDAREIVTLASIIEAEAKVPSERPLIASVYRNRLARGMLLEADPTVQYALGGHRERVLYEDLEVDSPYNTYRNPGLPPGPIGSPGRASLEAAVDPDSTPYLFFFWIGDSAGTHTFSTTHAEHLRKRRELGR